MCLGGIQQLRGHNFAIFDPAPYMDIFIPWAGTRTHFLGRYIISVLAICSETIQVEKVYAHIFTS